MTGLRVVLYPSTLHPSRLRRPYILERLARHSLFDRYMKAQLRLAGGRRKLGRNGFSSDRPRECVDPPEYLRDLRDLAASETLRHLLGAPAAGGTRGFALGREQKMHQLLLILPLAFNLPAHIFPRPAAPRAAAPAAAEGETLKLRPPPTISEEERKLATPSPKLLGSRR